MVSGSVKLRSTFAEERVLLTVVGPQDVFGALSIIDHRPRMTSATTITAVRAVAMGEDSLRSMIVERPALAEQFMQMLARRVKRTDDEIVDLFSTDGPGRIARQLLHLAQRFGTPEPSGALVVHDLTQIEIAQLAGSTRETVSKAMSAFADRGWIKVGRRSVLIIDPDRLAGRAR